MSQYDLKFDLKLNNRSLLSTFHGPVILPYILKSTGRTGRTNIILMDYESV